MSTPEELCHDLNTMSAWLALDNFSGQNPDALVLLGNQVVATLTAACRLAQRTQSAALAFSGGAGHSTGLLYENLRVSVYGALVAEGAIRDTMAEAEMYAVVAHRAFDLPAGRILLEKRSRNGGENARFSVQAMKDAQVRQATVLILQDPIMQRRSVLTWAREAEQAGVEAQVLSHAAFVPRVEVDTDGGLRMVRDQARETWTPERFVGLVLGEIQRLRDDADGYGPRGRNFLPHVEIPEPVLQSYRRVAASSLASMAAR